MATYKASSAVQSAPSAPISSEGSKGVTVTTTEIQWPSPLAGTLAPGWLEMKDPTGRTIYCNPTAGRTSWVKPIVRKLPPGWVKSQTPEGKAIFIHSQTQQCSYEWPVEATPTHQTTPHAHTSHKPPLRKQTTVPARKALPQKHPGLSRSQTAPVVSVPNQAIVGMKVTTQVLGNVVPVSHDTATAQQILIRQDSQALSQQLASDMAQATAAMKNTSITAAILVARQAKTAGQTVTSGKKMKKLSKKMVVHTGALGVRTGRAFSGLMHEMVDAADKKGKYDPKVKVKKKAVAQNMSAAGREAPAQQPQQQQIDQQTTLKSVQNAQKQPRRKMVPIPQQQPGQQRSRSLPQNSALQTPQTLSSQPHQHLQQHPQQPMQIQDGVQSTEYVGEQANRSPAAQFNQLNHGPRLSQAWSGALNDQQLANISGLQPQNQIGMPASSQRSPSNSTSTGISPVTTFSWPVTYSLQPNTEVSRDLTPGPSQDQSGSYTISNPPPYEQSVKKASLSSDHSTNRLAADRRRSHPASQARPKTATAQQDNTARSIDSSQQQASSSRPTKPAVQVQPRRLAQQKHQQKAASQKPGKVAHQQEGSGGHQGIQSSGFLQQLGQNIIQQQLQQQTHRQKQPHPKQHLQGHKSQHRQQADQQQDIESDTPSYAYEDQTAISVDDSTDTFDDTTADMSIYQDQAVYQEQPTSFSTYQDQIAYDYQSNTYGQDQTLYQDQTAATGIDLTPTASSITGTSSATDYYSYNDTSEYSEVVFVDDSGGSGDVVYEEEQQEQQQQQQEIEVYDEQEGEGFEEGENGYEVTYEDGYEDGDICFNEQQQEEEAVVMDDYEDEDEDEDGAEYEEEAYVEEDVVDVGVVDGDGDVEVEVEEDDDVEELEIQEEDNDDDDDEEEEEDVEGDYDDSGDY